MIDEGWLPARRWLSIKYGSTRLLKKTEGRHLLIITAEGSTIFVGHSPESLHSGPECGLVIWVTGDIVSDMCDQSDVVLMRSIQLCPIFEPERRFREPGGSGSEERPREN